MSTSLKTDPNKGGDFIALCWWIRVMVNIYAKLYQPLHHREFFRDYEMIVSNIRRYRGGLRARGWDVPNLVQEKLIAALVDRCRKYLVATSDSTGRQFIPGYLLRSLQNYIEELADTHARDHKMNPFKGANAQDFKKLFETLQARAVSAKIE